MKRLLVMICLIFLVGCNDKNVIPTKSILENASEDDVIQLIFDDSSEIEFLTRTPSFKEIKKYVQLSDVTGLDIKSKIETFSFVFTYTDEILSGSTEMTAVIDTSGKKDVVISLEYKPLELKLMDDNIVMDKTSLFKYYNGLQNFSGIELSSGVLKHTFQLNQLKNIEVIEPTSVINRNKLKEVIRLNFSMNVIECTTDAEVYYTRDSLGHFVVSSIEMDLSSVEFSSPRTIIGRWGALYKQLNENFFGVMVVNSYNEQEGYYEGKYIMASFEDWPRGDMQTRGIYDFTLHYDLDQDQLIFKAGEWIQPAHDFPKLEFNMNFDQNMNIYCEPTNWVNESSEMFVLTQEYDTYDYD